MLSRDSRTAASSGYKPGLDGLRALAVAAVILYHANVSWARAGFLGVDVFFVLSGYLITSLLLAEHHASGRIDLAAFWARRARRLLPALFLVLVAVAAYAALGAQPTELGRIRTDGFASLLYVSNWKFIFDGTSYFQAFRAPSPLAHTWSLAIEEQWYLLWPLALLLMLRAFRGRLRVLAGAITGLAVGSAVLMAALFKAGSDPSRVYYGTDTRAQALLIGAALAALAAGAHPVLHLDRLRRPWILQTAGLIGAAAVAAMIVRVDYANAFLYRGGFLLVASASAILVAAATVEGPVSAVLSVRPLRAVGVVSYGLYLWHWPVDVALNATRTGLSGLSLIATQVAVTAALATVSYHLVERPIRRQGLGTLRRPALARVRLAVLPLTIAIVAALLSACTVGAVSEPDLAAFVHAQRAVRAVPDPKHARVLLLGDSQMLTLTFYGKPAFTSSGPQYEFAAIVGCGIFDPGMQSQGSCADRAAVWKERIRRFNPDLSAVLLGAWETLDFTVDGHTYVHGTPEHEQELVKVIFAALRTLTARNGRVALLEVPCFGDPSAADADGRQRSSPASVSNVNQALRTVAEQHPNQITFVPWADAICPGGHFAAKVDGVTPRPDGVHVASGAAAKLVTDRIVPKLRSLAVIARAARVTGRS